MKVLDMCIVVDATVQRGLDGHKMISYRRILTVHFALKICGSMTFRRAAVHSVASIERKLHSNNTVTTAVSRWRHCYAMGEYINALSERV